MSNRNQIEQEVITNKFVSEWTPRFPQIPVKYENRNFTPPVNQPWVSFSIRSGRVAEAAISAIMPRGIGIVYLQIFLPENAGTLIAREMTDRLADVFDNWHYVYAATTNYPRGDFWFKRVEVAPAGIRDGWTQWNATVEFKHDEQVIVPDATTGGGGDMYKADYAYGGGQSNTNEVDHAMYADAAPVQAGVMVQSVYDTNADHVVDHAALADVVAWAGVTGKPATFPPDATAELAVHKGQTGGYAALDIQGKVPVAQLPVLSQSIETISWLAGANPNGATIFVANRSLTITGITGVVETVNGAAATVSVVKAASGTALSAGTVVHSGSFDANGTAATNQPLTLTVTTMNAGDRLGLVSTGTFTNSVANISVFIQ